MMKQDQFFTGNLAMLAGDKQMARNFQPAGSAKQGIRQVGDRLARRLGIALTEVRYATYDVHDGERWTIRAQWERCIGGRWVEVDGLSVPNSYDR